MFIKCFVSANTLAFFGANMLWEIVTYWNLAKCLDANTLAYLSQASMIKQKNFKQVDFMKASMFFISRFFLLYSSLIDRKEYFFHG